MRAVNLSYAKAHLDRLVDEALAGEEIVIAKAGTPVVRLAPVAAPKRRVFGLDQGKIVIPEDFDEPLSELEQDIYGGVDDPS
jgi:prevent-host-death family protein